MDNGAKVQAMLLFTLSFFFLVIWEGPGTELQEEIQRVDHTKDGRFLWLVAFWLLFLAFIGPAVECSKTTSCGDGL